MAARPRHSHWMRFLGIFVISVAAGCGRIDFDAGQDLALAPCHASARAPDPVTIRGDTFRFSSFANTRDVVAGATVTAQGPTGALLAQTTSDTTGAYTLTIPTGGTAPRVALRFEHVGDFITTMVLDLRLDHDVVAPDATLYTIGDGPLWSGGSMASVYSSASLSVDPARSTIDVLARDCADQPLDGVEITITPAPQLASYLTTSGLPSAALTGTNAPFTIAVAFNAVPGATHITARKPGLTFLDQDVVIPGGDFMTLLTMRPAE